MNREPLLNGQIDLLLLAVLARGALHGYALIETLRGQSGGTFDLREGTVYPALYRLERAGLLRSDSRKVGGRPRRTYHVTDSGRAALRERRSAWEVLVRQVNAVLSGEGQVAHG